MRPANVPRVFSRQTGARMAGEAAHVHLVHDGLRRRPLKGSIALPVVRGDVDHDALHCRCGVVARAARVIAAVAFPEPQRHGRTDPVEPWRDRSAFRRGIERPLDPIAVQLAGPYAGHEHVPVVVGPVHRWIEADDARGPRVVDTIEQQQLDARCVLREDTEVDAVVGRRRSQRRAAAFLQAVAHGLPSSSLAAAATRSGSKPNFS